MSVMHVQHIIQHHTKMVYWSLESRRLDFVWVEGVPNTFPFRNLAPEPRIFG